MILFILPLIALAAPTILGAIDYLKKLLFPPVPDTTPLAEPYTPPFTGGQCPVIYVVDISFLEVSSGNRVIWANGNSVTGSIASATAYEDRNGSSGIVIVGNGVTRDVSLGGSNFYRNYQIHAVRRNDGLADNCGNVPNPNPSLPIGGNGLPSSPPPVLYPPPNSPPNTPPTTPNNNWFQLIAGAAALVGAASAAAASAAAAAAGTAITAGAAASAAGAAASASAPSGSTTQKQADSQKLSADALVGIAQVLAEVAKQITELEKEVRKLKTDEAKKEKDDAKKIIRYDFGSANRDGFIKLYPDSNPDGYQATFIDVRIMNIPIGSGRYFGDKSPHFYKYQSLGQIHFVSPTFGILESREIDFARLSLNVPDNCFGFFYHFGLNGIINANLSGFYTKTEKQAV